MSSHGVLYDKFWGKMNEWTSSRKLTPAEISQGRQQRDSQEDSLLSLTNAEANYNALRRNPGNIVITTAEAQQIFLLFTGRTIAASRINDDARAFLQGALMAAVDGSFAMGFVQIIFDSAYMRLPPSSIDGVRKLVFKVTRKMFKHYFKHMKEIDPMDAPLYKIVVGAISYQCSAYFQMIEMGDAA